MPGEPITSYWRRYDRSTMEYVEDAVQVAHRIVAYLNPDSVLDVRRAPGELAEHLRELGVDATELDTPDAIAEPLERKHDLVLCIAVLEHLSAPDAERTIENLCAASDRVLFSSSPSEYAEPRHANVQPPEVWSAQFARQNFVRNLEFDGSFVGPWATLYERSHAVLPDVVRAYDCAWWRLRSEVQQVREQVLDLHAQVEQRDGVFADENIRLRTDLLGARDEIIGHEARLGEALGQIELLESELRRQKDALADAERLLGSRSGRLLRAWHRLRAMLA
jgi:hypothetical protein